MQKSLRKFANITENLSSRLEPAHLRTQRRDPQALLPLLFWLSFSQKTCFSNSTTPRRILFSMSTVAETAPIRTAVIGYGLAGRVFHCPFIAAVPGLELTTIIVANPDRAAAAHAIYPQATVVPQLATVLNDPSIDLIVIGTPNSTHVELATAALHAGKHVVVDKPLAANSADARALIELATAQGKLLAPFHNRRYDGDFLTLSKLVAEGTLGRIVTVLSHYDRFRPLQRPNSWKEASGPASGNLFDLGPHLVDQALALFGVPTHVTASVRYERDRTDIDDAADIVFDYSVPALPGEPAKQLRYVCSETMLAADPCPRFRVHGTLGSFTKTGLDPQEAALIKGTLPPPLGSPQPWFPEPESAWGTLTLATKRTEPVEYARTPYPTVPGDYRRFYANVRDAVRSAAPLAIPAEDGFRTIRLLELALQSSQERRTVAIDFT
jgi:scyllo-inositol 2-dehydrogenase (NADP+)